MLLQMACQNIQNWQNHESACNSFMDQSSKAVQIQQYDQKIEDYFTIKAKDEVTSDFGKEPLEVAGGAAYGYRAYRNKSVDFKLPTMGLADSVSNRITPNSYSLNLSWKMPWLK
jgi:hypothetical protein